MSLNEYKPGTAFNGVLGAPTTPLSRPGQSPSAPKEGAPNVLFVVLDDVGFGQLGCYGSQSKSQYGCPGENAACATTNMHTTALCSRRAPAS